jgi:hypothetical protein
VKVEWRLFAGAGAFFVVTSAAYWFVSYEDAGTTMLATSVLAFAFIGVWLWFQTRGRGPRPEDVAEAGPAEAAGEEIGFFPSASLWPFVLGGGAAVAGVGLVFGPPIFAVGILVMAAGVVGYAREAEDKL